MHPDYDMIILTAIILFNQHTPVMLNLQKNAQTWDLFFVSCYVKSVTT